LLRTAHGLLGFVHGNTCPGSCRSGFPALFNQNQVAKRLVHKLLWGGKDTNAALKQHIIKANWFTLIILRRMDTTTPGFHCQRIAPACCGAWLWPTTLRVVPTTLSAALSGISFKKADKVEVGVNKSTRPLGPTPHGLLLPPTPLLLLGAWWELLLWLLAEQN
jgi:hypothetical protein